MKSFFKTALVGAFAFALSTSGALAHAHLQKATPAVGATVSSAAEIRLTFSETIEPKFSSVTLSDPSGNARTLGPVGVDPSDAATIVVKIAKPLAPGVYTVKWRAVSTDTHHTQGAFDFTIKP